MQSVREPTDPSKAAGCAASACAACYEGSCGALQSRRWASLPAHPLHLQQQLLSAILELWVFSDLDRTLLGFRQLRALRHPFHVLVGALLISGESARYRYFIQPLLWIAAAAAGRSLWRWGARRRRQAFTRAETLAL